MSSATVRGADAKEFVKCFNGICQWNNGWDRWNDMVNMFAITIANTVDLNNREKREELYAHTAGKYKPEELNRFAELFAVMVDAMERNPFQDFLGQMYMELNMGSKSHGQCFTPFSVCQLMVETAMPEEKIRQKLEEHGWISINDCTCGAGAILIAAAERLHLMGVNYQRHALFVAQDLDSTVAMMCYIQLSLLGCAGRVRIGDTLMNPDNSDVLMGDGKPNTWYMPMFYSDIWSGRVFARYMDLLTRPKSAQRAPEAERPSENPPEEAQAPEPATECAEMALECTKPEKNAQNTEENAQKEIESAAFILTTARRTKKSMSEGQLMFDLTGGM